MEDPLAAPHIGLSVALPTAFSDTMASENAVCQSPKAGHNKRKGPRHTQNSMRSEFAICSEFTTDSNSL